MNFTNITLGELLSSSNETIKRNAFSILKQLQKERDTTHTCIWRGCTNKVEESGDECRTCFESHI